MIELLLVGEWRSLLGKTVFSDKEFDEETRVPVTDNIGLLSGIHP